jgi:hypothetical protein
MLCDVWKTGDVMQKKSIEVSYSFESFTTSTLCSKSPISYVLGNTSTNVLTTSTG